MDRIELVGLTLVVEVQIFPGLWIYCNMEISILEIYGHYPFTCLQGSPYAFCCLNFEFL